MKLVITAWRDITTSANNVSVTAISVTDGHFSDSRGSLLFQLFVVWVEITWELPYAYSWCVVDVILVQMKLPGLVKPA